MEDKSLLKKSISNHKCLTYVVNYFFLKWKSAPNLSSRQKLTLSQKSVITSKKTKHIETRVLLPAKNKLIEKKACFLWKRRDTFEQFITFKPRYKKYISHSILIWGCSLSLNGRMPRGNRSGATQDHSSRDKSETTTLIQFLTNSLMI